MIAEMAIGQKNTKLLSTPFLLNVSAGSDSNACGTETTLTGKWDDTDNGVWSIIRGGSEFKASSCRNR